MRRLRRAADLRDLRHQRRRRSSGTTAVRAVRAAAADAAHRRPRRSWCGSALQVYQRETRPLVEFYRARPTFRTIDGNQPPDGSPRRCRGSQGSVGGDAAGGLEQGGVIVCKSPAELEQMRAAGPAGRRGCWTSWRRGGAGRDHRRPRRDRREAGPRRGRRPRLQGLPRVSRDALRLGQRGGGARDPVGEAG